MRYIKMYHMQSVAVEACKSAVAVVLAFDTPVHVTLNKIHEPFHYFL